MRSIYQDIVRDGNGIIISSASVNVFLAGTTTPANVYTAPSGGVAVNSVTSGSDGSYLFYVDPIDYSGDQLFKVIITKRGFSSITEDNIDIFGGGSVGVDVSNYTSLTSAVLAIGPTPTTLYIRNNTTITATTTVPSTLSIEVIYPGSITKVSGSLIVNSSFKAGLFQVFIGFSPGDVTFSSIKEAYPQWWGGGPGISDSTGAIQSALSSTKIVHLTSGTWIANIVITKANELYGNAGTSIRPYSSSSSIVTVDGTNDYIVGASVHDLALSGLGLTSGMTVTALTPNVVAGSRFERLIFWDTTSAVRVTTTAAGEVYNCSFRDIYINGITSAGIYTNLGAYNTFERFNITGVADGGQAVVEISLFHTYKQLAVDGIILSQGTGASWEDITIEGIYATTPPSNIAFYMQGYFSTIKNLMLTDVPNTKCDTGVSITNTNHIIDGVNWNGTLRPNTMVLLGGGSTGTISNIRDSVSNLWEANPATIWNWNVLTGSSKSEIISDYTVTSATNDYFVANHLRSTNMWATRDEGYDFEFILVSGFAGTSTYQVYFGDGVITDTTATHYTNTYIQGGATSPPIAGKNNDSTGTGWSTFASGEHTIITGHICLSTLGDVILQYTAVQHSTNGNVTTGSIVLTPTTPFAELRGIEIASDRATGIGVDSRFRMWRKRLI